jgi:hypothetical protein
MIRHLLVTTTLAQDDKIPIDAYFRFVDLRQQIWLRLIAHQVRVALASVVVELVGFVVVGVLDRELLRGAVPVLPAFRALAQNFGRVLAAIDGNELHARTDTGHCRGHALRRICNCAVVAEFEADGKRSTDDVEVASRRRATISDCDSS